MYVSDDTDCAFSENYGKVLRYLLCSVLPIRLSHALVSDNELTVNLLDCT